MCSFLSAGPAVSDPGLSAFRILINHVGYEMDGAKNAVIRWVKEEGNISSCEVVDYNTGETVFKGKIEKKGPVQKWKNWQFATFDFSAFKRPGTYYLKLTRNETLHWSMPFKIREHLLLEETLSDVIFHFKTQRCTGIYDRRDRAVPFHGGRKGTVDVHGGWYDASGDTSKYLSHHAYTNYMTPQQSPLSIWILLDSRDILKGSQKGLHAEVEKRLLDEASYGSDFLVRMQDKAGYFYPTVFDKWSKNLDWRKICAYSTQDGILNANYQAAYREGGGMAIAALARVAASGLSSDYTKEKYLAVAEKGFAHLEKNSIKYLDDGKENIIDDYCALLAAAELYNATKEQVYLTAAEKRVSSLLKRLSSDQKHSGWWRADDKGDVPYFHAADAGLPIISLVRFLQIKKDSPLAAKIKSTIKKSLQFELKVTAEVVNPFGYARQYSKALGEKKKTSFFYPHKNPSGYWWQGENARLASLAAAANKAVTLFKDDAGFCAKLRAYSTNQLNWILGLNPFDMCMLHGHGRNNPVYDPGYHNAPGGIANGITAGFKDEDDIDYLPMEIRGKGDHTWRWSEQWLSHPTWYLLAVSSGR
ncbi:MAG: hypothetical protein GY757_13625 [bacterium]|nr:hypothetical protein [bacterium]